MAGPLSGIKIVELAGIGPSPYACMLLADAGAQIIRLDRPGHGAQPTDPWYDLMVRSRPSVGVDLKHPEGKALALELIASADAVIEGYRPGVAERLGLGPEDAMAVNEALVYGRMTGWGQDGPLGPRAGHDINYIAISGALWPIGRAGERPVPPLNLVGDFGGGGMLLAFGMCAALLEAKVSGKGQVVDAAMVDGAASLMTMTFGFASAGMWKPERGTNILDTGAHFYEVYETSDAKYMAVGAIERKFYAELLDGLGLDPAELPDQMDQGHWGEMKERFAAIFATKTRDEWTTIFEDRDACTTPVLAPHEAHLHRHNAARGTFVEVGEVIQPGPAPRFSKTPSAVTSQAAPPGAHTDAGLGAWGLDAARIAQLRAAGAIG